MSAYSGIDLSTSTTEQLIMLYNEQRAAIAGEGSITIRRARELRIAEIERWIAIHNARATAALDDASVVPPALEHFDVSDVSISFPDHAEKIFRAHAKPERVGDV